MQEININLTNKIVNKLFVCFLVIFHIASGYIQFRLYAFSGKPEYINVLLSLDLRSSIIDLHKTKSVWRRRKTRKLPIFCLDQLWNTIRRAFAISHFEKSSR